MKYGDQKSKCILACELKKEGIVSTKNLCRIRKH